MVKRKFTIIVLTVLILICNIMSSCFLVTDLDVWYQYNFRAVNSYTLLDDGIYSNTEALEYNEQVYVGEAGYIIDYQLVNKQYNHIGFIDAFSPISSALLGFYYLYTHQEDTDIDFIFEHRNKSDIANRVYLSNNAINKLYSAPIISLKRNEVDIEVQENICINDIIGQESLVALDFWDDKINCDIYIEEDWSFIENLRLWTCCYYKDNNFYFRKFSTEDYKYYYYVIKPEYYDLFSSFM